MEIKRIENAGVIALNAHSSNVSMPAKRTKQTSELSSLLSNSSKSEKTDKSFAEENKILLIGGGLLTAAAIFLITKKFNSSKGIKELLTSIFTNPAKKMQAEAQKITAETQNFIAKETELFYSKTRTLSNIADFEQNKAILSEALNKYQKEFFLQPQRYKNLIEFLRKNGLSQEIIPAKIANPEHQYLYNDLLRKHRVKWETAKEIYFKQKDILNPNLAEIKANISTRKLTFGEGTEEIPRFMETGYTRKEIEKMLTESKNLTLENGSLLAKNGYQDRIYDLPFKFASASYNSLAKNGNAYIKGEIPEIFKGIDEKELFESLDLLSTHLRRSIECNFPKGCVVNIKIGGKEFNLTSLGSGLEGSVFKISAKGQKPVILKNYFAENDLSPFGVSVAPSGLYGGLGILREANFAKVADVPKLYMANPIYIPVKNASSRYMGAWQLTEDASIKSISKGPKLTEWLESKKLFWIDDKKDAFINGICIDTGFIMNTDAYKHLCDGWGDYNLNLLYSQYLNGKTTQQILDFLSNCK